MAIDNKKMEEISDEQLNDHTNSLENILQKTYNQNTNYKSQWLTYLFSKANKYEVESTNTKRMVKMKVFDFLFEESLCSLVYMREIVDENKNKSSINNTSLDDHDLDQINIVKENAAEKFMVQEKTIFNLNSYIENSLMSHEELQRTLKAIKYAQHLAFTSCRDLNDLKEIENNQFTTA